MRHRGILLAGLVLALSALGCRSADDPARAPAASRLTVGVLPDQSPDELRRQHGPLLAHLSATAGVELTLFVPGSYEELVEAFTDGRVQLGWFGGLTYVHAERAAAAVPLVMRDVDLEFTSAYLVRDTEEGRSLEDFAGRSFAFGPVLSTSGHLMPRFQLAERGIDPEQHFGAVLHSAGHDQTAAWVRDGTVALGVANAVIVESLRAEGRLSGVRVLQRTLPYRDYVWAARPDVDPGVRDRLLDAFLALDRTRAEHRQVLTAQGARSFIPASRSDYAEIRAAAAEHERRTGGSS